eukprot:s2427_g16.t2
MASPATATETNPTWQQMQEVTAKLRQTEKQAERIKENLRQLNSALAARPQMQMHRSHEEQPDVVSSQARASAPDKVQVQPPMRQLQQTEQRQVQQQLLPKQQLQQQPQYFQQPHQLHRMQPGYAHQIQHQVQREYGTAMQRCMPGADISQPGPLDPQPIQQAQKDFNSTAHKQMQEDNLRQLNSAWAARPQMHRPREATASVPGGHVQAAVKGCIVTAKLRQTEKQAERIKDNLRQLNSAWAARPQMHRPHEEQLDVVSSQVERKARDLSDWTRLLKKESGIRRRISACLGPSCRGLHLCGNGFGTSASPPSRDEGALQDKPPLRQSQLEALAPPVPAGLKQTENSSLASTSTGIVSPPELPEEPCLERHTCVVDEEVPQLIRVRADRQDVRETPRHQDTLTTLPEHLPRDLTQKYKFIDAHSLGSGAVARVCRMQELETGRHVAVKVVEKYPLQIRNMITQMEREIRVHKRLRHPNILRLHACFEDSTHWYMVLELASRLVNLLVRHPWKRLREPQAGWLFGQVVDGVSHLHQKGCVHRDLKPDNVLIVEDCPKICDFGWCAELNEGQRRTFCGTFDYMAPEVWKGERNHCLHSS